MQAHRRRTAAGQIVDPTCHMAVLGVDEMQERTRALISDLTSATVAERLAIREEVVILNLSLANAAARRYGPPSEFDDLVQIARCGLVEAFDRFDPEQSSYATFAWITMVGLLRRHLRDHGWSIRPPRSLQESANKLRKVMPELTQDLGRTPRAVDAAERLGWTLDAVHEARLANQGMRRRARRPSSATAGCPSSRPSGTGSRLGCCSSAPCGRCRAMNGSCSGCGSATSSVKLRSASSWASTRWESRGASHG